MNPDELLTQATCAVLIDGQIAGTAWLASREGYLLTAGHVLGIEQPITHVEVQFMGATEVPRRAEKIEWRFDQQEALDFAVLKLTVPISRRPLPISLAKNVQGTFRLCGYGTELKKNAQFSGRGEFSGPMYTDHSVRTHLFALRSLDFGKEGNSGGAIFSENEQAAVGIMIEAAATSIGLQHDVVLAIPLYRVAQFFPLLEQLAKGGSKGGIWGKFRQVLSKFWARRRAISKGVREPVLAFPLIPTHLILTEKRRLTNIFICYKRDASLDRQFADYLYDFLTAQNYHVFIDKSMPGGTVWSEKIDRELQASDLLVVLLSQKSVEDEMVRSEVRRAYDYRKLQEFPRTLPIRMAYEGLLPYAIDAFLDPLQYVVWQSAADNERVGQEILATIRGELLPQRRVPPLSMPTKSAISEDERVATGKEIMLPPLPEVNPNFLEELVGPGGAYIGPLYVERKDDVKLKQQLDRVGAGSFTIIRAARQTGKTSLLVQSIRHARQNGMQVVNLDLQRMDWSYLATPEHFCRYLAEYIVWELDLDLDQVEKMWRGPLGSLDKLTRLLARYVLPQSNQAGILLAMDEADRLLKTNFSTDFFAIVRSWHNSRAYSLDSPWRKMHLILVISTEPNLLIADDTQSPFNQGLRLYLEDFTTKQVEHLNHLHGSPLKVLEIRKLMTLLNGHPYLTQKALYALVTESLTWASLSRDAFTNYSPFVEHLRRYHWLLRDKEELKAGLREVMRHQRCSNGITRYRLLRAGLVKGDSERCVFRCDLYRRYFEDKL